jgi:2-polyprenyl-3-methyl-5-hydroxy-6-metoxy-1,4-benzoquinol methylase
MKHVKCLICGSDDHEDLVSYNNDKIFKKIPHSNSGILIYAVCRNCGFVFTNPMLDDNDLKLLYEKTYRENAVINKEYLEKKVDIERKTYLWIQEQLGERFNKGRVLDVGCGTGALLALYRAKGWEVYGLEPTEKLAIVAKERFNLYIKTEFFTENSFPDIKFDFICFSHMLEHVPDPGMLLEIAKTKLTENGLIYISVPTLFRPIWPIFSRTLSASHLYIFSHSSLKTLTAKHGFEIIAMGSYFLGIRLVIRPAAPASKNISRDDYKTIKKLFALYNDPVAPIDIKNTYSTNLVALHYKYRTNISIPFEIDFSRIDLEINEEDIMSLSIKNDDGEFVSLREEQPYDLALDINDKTTVIVLGFGLGGMPYDILKQLDAEQRLVIFELDKTCFQISMFYRSHFKLISDKRVKLIVGEENILKKYFELYISHYRQNIKIVKNPSSYPLHKQRYDDLLKQYPYLMEELQNKSRANI